MFVIDCCFVVLCSPVDVACHRVYAQAQVYIETLAAIASFFTISVDDLRSFLIGSFLDFLVKFSLLPISIGINSYRKVSTFNFLHLGRNDTPGYTFD